MSAHAIATSTRPMRMPSALALVVAGPFTLALGCDADALRQQADEARAEDRALADDLARENARIDSAAADALASAGETTARGGTVPGRTRAPAIPDAIDRPATEVAPGDLERARSEFVAQAREQLERMQAEVQGIEALTHRRIDDLDASLEADRRRAEEQLERLKDETRAGYARARDTLAQDLRELDTRLQRLRRRLAGV